MPINFDDELCLRMTYIEGEIKYMSKVLERLDTLLPTITENAIQVKALMKKQENCPSPAVAASVDALDTRVQSLEHFSNLYKYLWIGVIGFLGYLEKQAVWQALQRTFS